MGKGFFLYDWNKSTFSQLKRRKNKKNGLEQINALNIESKKDQNINEWYFGAIYIIKIIIKYVAPAQIIQILT